MSHDKAERFSSPHRMRKQFLTGRLACKAGVILVVNEEENLHGHDSQESRKSHRAKGVVKQDAIRQG